MTTSSVHLSDPIRRRVFVAFALVAAAATYLLLAPAYSGTTARVSTASDGTQTTVTTEHTATLVEVNGPRTYLILGFPVLVALVPLLVPGARRCRIAAYVSGVILVAFAAITGFSVGPIFSAGALGMMLAAALPVKSVQGSGA